jgi:hypothetical protein
MPCGDENFALCFVLTGYGRPSGGGVTSQKLAIFLSIFLFFVIGRVSFTHVVDKSVFINRFGGLKHCTFFRQRPINGPLKNEHPRQPGMIMST